MGTGVIGAGVGVVVILSLVDNIPIDNFPMNLLLTPNQTISLVMMVIVNPPSKVWRGSNNNTINNIAIILAILNNIRILKALGFLTNPTPNAHIPHKTINITINQVVIIILMREPLQRIML